jgi:hypothetical protein
MTQTEACRHLHDMVDEMAKMSPDMWAIGLPQIRITFSDNDGTDAWTLVVGLDTASRDDD